MRIGERSNRCGRTHGRLRRQEGMAGPRLFVRRTLAALHRLHSRRGRKQKCDRDQEGPALHSPMMTCGCLGPYPRLHFAAQPKRRLMKLKIAAVDVPA